MRINLNIIKILLLVFLSMGTTMSAVDSDDIKGVFDQLDMSTSKGYFITDICQVGGCNGCEDIGDDIADAADEIDEHHAKLEENLSKLYEEKIIFGEGNLTQIDWLQEDIAKKVAHIRALEYEANIESRHIISVLRKNKDLYTLPVGAVQ